MTHTIRESALRRIIVESISRILRESEDDSMLQAAARRGVRTTGGGTSSPAVNGDGDFLKIYQCGNGHAICIGGRHGTRPIPPGVWEDIGMWSNGTGLSFQEALRIMLKIGDYYNLF